MKILTFDISKSEILEVVAEFSAYAGTKLAPDDDDGKTFFKVATLSDDALLLSRFLADAGAECLEKLKDFVTDTSFNGTSFHISLEVSEAYDDAATPFVLNSLKSFLAAAVLARWMSLAMPSQRDEWKAEAFRILSEVERRLYHRVRPRRKSLT